METKKRGKTREGTDTIGFAFYGYNSSGGCDAGLADPKIRFRRVLESRK